MGRLTVTGGSPPRSSPAHRVRPSESAPLGARPSVSLNWYFVLDPSMELGVSRPHIAEIVGADSGGIGSEYRAGEGGVLHSGPVARGALGHQLSSLAWGSSEICAGAMFLRVP